jgi:maltooligosyltrehalose trehalohydrolase
MTPLMTTQQPQDRKFPFGAEIKAGYVDFRVWAPKRKRVALFLPETDRLLALEAEEQGYFSLRTDQAQAGSRYFFRLDDDPFNYPDPASRYQPDGVHAASEVVDPLDFSWADDSWQGLDLLGQVIYELHLGCFTSEGTWRAAEAKLPHLAETGVTVIEVMPVAEFDGDFGWGYDGVQWYAPSRLYGRPADFRRFVNAAHQCGMAVILDVVYNHFGPSGNYLGAFSPYFVSKRHPTDWGEAINYDGEQAEHVRSFAISNAAYWIDEFHLDGLRLDATQSIYDDSPRHLLSDMSVACRKVAMSRKIILIAENESQDVRHVEAVEDGGFGLDGLWNDDFHHSCRVAATGHAEYYYSDFHGSPQELISATRYGYLYQGQYEPRRDHSRGTPCWHVDACRFITYLQNHDQVANSAMGWRLPQQTSPGRYRALTTLWLLGPGTPMLFMGQEFATRNPFRYFADHEVELAQMVREGRWEAMRNFPSIAGWEGGASQLPDPADRSTFMASKLNWEDLERNTPDFMLHRDLLRLRRSERVFARQNKLLLQGAVLGTECFLLRWHHDTQDDRLLIVNLGRDYEWHPASEPLVAPPRGRHWQLKFSSEDQIYGGSGTALLNTRHWHLPGHAAILLAAVETD